EQVAADAENLLGPLARFRRILENARRVITEGALITATPTLPGFQFNPPSMTLGFFEDWHRFEFKMRARDAPLNAAANGLLTFMADGIIAADIPLSVFVAHDVAPSAPQATPARPIYDTVFASYSHKDTAVVLKVEAAAKTFGMTYLRDVITLRSGEDWSVGLEKMIDDATIFQIFWSAPYSQSMHCRREWEYAVGLRREAVRFIRPVYWLQPMPDPPALLQHLHFAYQPDLVK
ncbi:MAG: toll/interleukin-1 receptor domain-containing protein, partial [Anaerolineae bacterium]|nr:toll/interleukin-1 receptor domain-containing protein [Anaerolineae bacterium]